MTVQPQKAEKTPYDPIDTGLNTDSGMDTGLEGIDAPDFEFPTVDYDSFKAAMSEGSTKPGGFERALKGDDAAGGGGREDIVKYAKQFLGVNYVWGGTSPSGFDCSGLIQYVAKKFGLNLPRISAQQARFGKETPLNQLRAGDLVAWDNSSRNAGADHIAFYIGNGYILEAPRPGAQVRIRKLGKKENAWGVALNYPK